MVYEQNATDKNNPADKMPTKKWTAGQNATGEGIALLQACADCISNKSLKETNWHQGKQTYDKLRENYCEIPVVDDILSIYLSISLYSSNNRQFKCN